MQKSENSIGEILKKAREKKGISLEEVHRVTKMHPRMLEALEEDRLEDILGRTYVKAFLKSYAHYLGLDVDEIVQQYTMKHSLETGEKLISGQKPILVKRQREFSRAIAITSALIVCLFILSFATLKFINHFKYVVKTKVVAVPQKAELGEKATEGTGTLPQEIEDIKRELIPIPKDRTITLTVTTDKDVWLKITQDGELAFHGILSKNTKETWRANNEIRLSEIGRPEALKLNVNGKIIDLSGKRLGKNILITQKGIDLELR